jgi:hypothetical protein
VINNPTFEEVAGAEKLAAWFRAQGFEIDAMAPRIDNDWAVEIFSTEEGLYRFPFTPHEPYPGERTFQLAASIIDAVDDDGVSDSTGWWWWDAENFHESPA